MTSSNAKSAVALTANAKMAATNIGKGPGFACMALPGLLVYNCYWKPGGPIEESEGFRARFEADVWRRDNPEVALIKSGNYNAKSPEWGSETRDLRDVKLEFFGASLSLWSHNIGPVPTFAIGGRTSVINVMLAQLPLGMSIRDWRVREDLYSDNGHRYIQFTVNWESRIPAKWMMQKQAGLWQAGGGPKGRCGCWISQIGR